MIKFKFIIVFAILFNTIIYGNSSAYETTKEMKKSFFDKTLYLTVQYGLLQQKFSSYLYHPNGFNASRLDWNNKATSILTFGLDFKPHDRWTISFVGNFSIMKKSGKFYMQDLDFDFTEQSRKLENISKHNKGKFQYIDVDLNARFRFYDIGSENDIGKFNFYVLAGFRYTLLDATAIDGISYYITGNIVRNFEDHFPTGTEVGRYKVNMYLPYIGVAFGYQYKNFDVLITFKNSILNYMTATDYHLLRELYTTSKHRFFYNYNLSFNMGYAINDYIRLFIIATMNQTLLDKNYTNADIVDSQGSWLYGVGKYKDDENRFGTSNFAYYFGIGANIALF